MACAFEWKKIFNNNQLTVSPENYLHLVNGFLCDQDGFTTQSDGELPVAFSHCKPKPSIHVVEIAALKAEQAKVKELVELLADANETVKSHAMQTYSKVSWNLADKITEAIGRLNA